MKKIIIAIACLWLTTTQAQAPYTLEKCKELALQNNTKSQNGQLAIEAAKQTKKEAFTNYFPSISGIGMGYMATDPMVEMATAYGPVGMLEKGLIGAVSATQPIFTGLQIITGNKLAKIGVQAAELQKTMSDDEVLLTVEQYYWQIVSLEEKVKTIAEAENLLNRAYTDVKNAYEAGLINKNDLLKVELKQNELESNKMKLANGMKLSKMVLAQFVGVPADGFEVDKSIETDMPLATQTDHNAALQQRSEYQLLDKNIEASKMQVRMKIGENLPTVAIGAGWNAFGFDQGSPTAMKNDFGMGFATVSVPITSWWGGAHAIKRQKLQVKIAENDKRNAEELLLIQMQQLWNEVEEAYAQMQLAEKTIASALENVSLNEDYYKAGTALLTDLLDAQSALQQARNLHTEAVTGYRMKLSRYRQATGQR